MTPLAIIAIFAAGAGIGALLGVVKTSGDILAAARKGRIEFDSEAFHCTPANPFHHQV